MIKNAIFVSVWDDTYWLESDCKVNTETLEVFDIVPYNLDDIEADLDSCTREYIYFIDEDEEHDVFSSTYCEDGDYWYA